MDLTLRIGNGYYNARVSAQIEYLGKYITDYEEGRFEFPIGGRVKFDENIEEALHREVMEELNVEIDTYELIAIAEATFESSAKDGLVHEHNFIFKCTLKGKPVGHFKLVDEFVNGEYKPPYWDSLDTKFLHTDMGDYSFDPVDICHMLEEPNEFNVRISALIRKGDYILFDESAYDRRHLVLIGGKMQMGESFIDALNREVGEELCVDVLSSTFLGHGEDFFDLKLKKDKHKHIHFISFVFEVEVDTDAIVFSDGARGVWKHKDELPDMHMSSVMRFIG